MYYMHPNGYMVPVMAPSAQQSRGGEQPAAKPKKKVGKMQGHCFRTCFWDMLSSCLTPACAQITAAAALPLPLHHFINRSLTSRAHLYPADPIQLDPIPSVPPLFLISCLNCLPFSIYLSPHPFTRPLHCHLSHPSLSLIIQIIPPCRVPLMSSCFFQPCPTH